jgi:EAL domain-containing protein (putative c-di-GMP-specific phosphodiesterase class I)
MSARSVACPSRIIVTDALDFEDWLSARSRATGWLVATARFVDHGTIGVLTAGMSMRELRTQISAPLLEFSPVFAGRPENACYVLVFADTPEALEQVRALRVCLARFCAKTASGAQIPLPASVQAVRIAPEIEVTGGAVLSLLRSMESVPSGSQWDTLPLRFVMPMTVENWRSRLVHDEMIRASIQQDRIELFAQSIHGVEADEDGAFEMFGRLRGLDGVLYGPQDFLPVAARYALLPQFDRAVVRHTLAWLGLHGGASRARYSVNLSTETVVSNDLEPYVLDALHYHRISPQTLCFEITESSSISDFAAAKTNVNALRALGTGVSIDDFGTGYASYAYLKALAVDEVKIDGSFVRGLDAGDALDEEIVNSIVRIAKLMGVRTVAECVETPAQVRRLSELGVDCLQGYYFDTPHALVSRVQA